MAAVIPGRMTVELEGGCVLFLIGMRINRPWKLGSWLPVARAMPRLIRELQAAPDSGFLGHHGLSMRVMVQYWRSLDTLMAYARDPERGHWPAWRDFNRRVKAGAGDVGIWHETYLVSPGGFEAIYQGVPPTGLGRFARLVAASGRRESAAGRLAAGHAGDGNGKDGSGKDGTGKDGTGKDGTG